MKKLKLITTISLLLFVAMMISSSTFAQKPKMKTFMYYVNVHLSAQQSYDEQYIIEILDQYGWRVLAPKTSRPGEHIYVFQETVPISVTGFNRVARVVFSPNHTRGAAHLLWASPDLKSILIPGNYYFNLYPIIMEERNSSSERNQKG